MTEAEKIMKRFNPNGLIGEDNNVVVMIEDHADPDGRLYRLEYQSTPDGTKAVAFCRYNPWGTPPNANEEYTVGHVDNDGFICVGQNCSKNVHESIYNLDYVIKRSRFWCVGFSVLKETGKFPDAEEDQAQKPFSLINFITNL